jgi:hypothetical protein
VTEGGTTNVCGLVLGQSNSWLNVCPRGDFASDCASDRNGKIRIRDAAKGSVSPPNGFDRQEMRLQRAMFLLPPDEPLKSRRHFSAGFCCGG